MKCDHRQTVWVNFGQYCTMICANLSYYLLFWLLWGFLWLLTYCFRSRYRQKSTANYVCYPQWCHCNPPSHWVSLFNSLTSKQCFYDVDHLFQLYEKFQAWKYSNKCWDSFHLMINFLPWGCRLRYHATNCRWLTT